MRFGVHLGPLWASFGGRRRRTRAQRPAPRALTPAGQRALDRQRREQLAEEPAARRRRIAAMTPEEYGRHLGMSEDKIARALFKLTAEDRQQADAELQQLRHEMGYRDQD
jgi:hypothetical protein